MRRIFTFSFIAIALSLASFDSFGQTCGTGGTFTPSFTYDFSSGVQGFAGDFTAGANRLNSTNVSAGTTKVLTSPTFTQPAGQTTLYWEFDLGGSANVTGYTVEAIYYNGSFQTVTVCTGGSVASGNNLIFNATAPAQILGQDFRLRITYTISGAVGQNITLDNFRTSAQVSNAVLPVKFQTFEAIPSNNSISLKWVVAAEENLSGYNVEKSMDGKNFSKIGFVAANSQSSYTFTDSKSSTTTYYRIRSIDLNGQYAFSTIAIIKAGQSMIMLNAFPSPFTNSFNVDHGTATSGNVITISGQDGRAIKTIIPTVGSQRTLVDLSTAKTGMYLVRYKNSNGDVETLKIFKQ
jgi:hypothetical protein